MPGMSHHVLECRSAQVLSSTHRMRAPRTKRSNTNRSPAMSVKVIVSYDGTANEDGATALGRLFAAAGAAVALAYVRHTHEPDRNRETLEQRVGLVQHERLAIAVRLVRVAHVRQ